MVNNTQRVNDLCQQALSLFQAGVKAADPYAATRSCLESNQDEIKIISRSNNDEHIRTAPWQKIHMIAMGKAACAMANAAQSIIPKSLLSSPILAVTNYENVTEIEGVTVIGAGHPLPDESGMEGAKAIAKKVAQARENELVLILLSGGASALTPYPQPPISLADKISCTENLLASGADIKQINCVRKHLSVLKGGGLARLCTPADVHTLILSDVLGDDLSSIASGPTVADETTYSDAIAILKKNHCWDQVPTTVKQHLEKGDAGEVPETLKPNDEILKRVEQTLIGSNRISLKAVEDAASNQFSTQIYSDELSGEARIAAENLVQYLLDHSHITEPTAILAGGETTVTLKGKGRGGRNQEMALAFALAAEKYGLNKLNLSWVFLSGGTDGRDGPTDAAGGIVHAHTLQRIQDQGYDAQKLLDDNDSYQALSLADGLVITGATGTNVADLQVLLVTPNIN